MQETTRDQTTGLLNGQYQNLMNTQGSLQLLVNVLNQDIEVLATSITAFYGLKRCL
ncbi:hypothetical protein OZX61_02310 [Acinetobacter sp. ESL0695]|uniref:hypothetical protein n=1 Tax=Acinetobacter sp. ESL0695 TaxID=2983215 RepID=UPI0023F3E60E|nr:hypothetical protein [Acinetobacter sp. ESL0695]WEV49342.1 hypothetical protein OZX61_02310 [Acinetobacter sp. ESL0695]